MNRVQMMTDDLASMRGAATRQPKYHALSTVSASLLRGCLVLAGALVVVACGPRTEPYITAPHPEPSGYASKIPDGTTAYANESLARLVADLTLVTEWGAKIERLDRFQTPVGIGVSGQAADAYASFLDDLLSEIRTEANVDIDRVASDPDLLIRFVPGKDWAPLADNQCIIIFGQPTLAEFLANEQKYSQPLKSSGDRRLQSVFIPENSEPYEIRECLIEEIVQALGPSNDIYGLADTIFNDDDAHTWPTKLDYLVLRVLYHPDMPLNADRDAMIGAALPILDQINPAGRDSAPIAKHRQDEFLGWRKRVYRLHRLMRDGRQNTIAARNLAHVILTEAESKAAFSPYHCEAASLHALLTKQAGSDNAMAELETAKTICKAAHGPEDVRLAKLRQSQALLALEEKQYVEALRRSEGLAEIFKAHGQDEEVATIYALRWVAMSWTEDRRLQKTYDLALKWSAYAYGDDNDIVIGWRGY